MTGTATRSTRPSFIRRFSRHKGGLVGAFLYQFIGREVPASVAASQTVRGAAGADA